MNLERFGLFGSSSGAMIAVEFASMLPENVSHLVILGGYVDGRSVRDGGSGAGDDVLLNMAKEGCETTNSAFISGILAVYFPTAKPDELLKIAQNLQNSCPAEVATLSRDFFNNYSIAHLLEKVQAPTLVMHSQGDAVHPITEAKKLARGITDAQLLLLDSRNHYPMPEEACWHSVVTEMLGFIES